ncbi:MAG: type II secretion system protein [Desulfobulbaceae bacterium]|nr:type II secretion system protein [Desulfobulbaceae bacterium]
MMRLRPPPFRSIVTGHSGFSLLEMIMVILLLGIIGALGVSSISNVIDGFLLSKDAAATASKGQLALLRLSREFRVIKSVTSASATSFTFKAKHGNTDAEDKTYTVTKNGSTITMNDGASTDILVDQVSALALAYYDTYNGSAQTTWSNTRTLVQVAITLNGPNNSAQLFTTRVAPRNL